jgi:hypothetical protein
MWTLPSASTLDTRKTLPDSDLRNSSLSLAGGWSTRTCMPLLIRTRRSVRRSARLTAARSTRGSVAVRPILTTAAWRQNMGLPGITWAVCAEHEVLGFASPQHMKNALYRFSVGRKEISLRSVVLDTSVMTPRSVLLSSGSSVASGTRHAEDPAELITRKTLPNNDLRNSSLLGTYST